MTPEQFEAWENVTDKANAYAHLYAAETSDEDECEMAITIQSARDAWVTALFEFHELCKRTHDDTGTRV